MIYIQHGLNTNQMQATKQLETFNDQYTIHRNGGEHFCYIFNMA